MSTPTLRSVHNTFTARPVSEKARESAQAREEFRQRVLASPDLTPNEKRLHILQSKALYAATSGFNRNEIFSNTDALCRLVDRYVDLLYDMGEDAHLTAKKKEEEDAHPTK